MRALFFLALAVRVDVMLLPRLAAWRRGQFGIASSGTTSS